MTCSLPIQVDLAPVLDAKAQLLAEAGETSAARLDELTARTWAADQRLQVRTWAALVPWAASGVLCIGKGKKSTADV